MIYEWHQENCSMAKKDERVELKKAWLRIEATLITRPEIMQRAIKHELDKFEKDIRKKRYPILEPLANKAEKRTTSTKTIMPRQRAYSVDSEAETAKASEELTAIDNDSSITEPDTTQPEEQRQTKKFICAGITCKIARREGTRVAREVLSMNSDNTKRTSLTEDESEAGLPPAMCQDCGQPREREGVEPETAKTRPKYKCCRVGLQQDDDPMYPCKSCQWLWLLREHDTETRVATKRGSIEDNPESPRQEYRGHPAEPQEGHRTHRYQGHQDNRNRCRNT
jgi:hypothetical protein